MIVEVILADVSACSIIATYCSLQDTNCFRCDDLESSIFGYFGTEEGVCCCEVKTRPDSCREEARVRGL